MHFRCIPPFCYASPIEIVWSTVYFVGLCAGLLAWRIARADEQWQYEHGGGTLARMYARSSLRQEQERCVKLALGLLAGMVSMATPPAAPHASPNRAVYATIGALVLMSLMMNFGSLRSYLDRRALKAEARRARNRNRRSTDVNPLPVVLAEKIEQEMEPEQ